MVKNKYKISLFIKKHVRVMYGICMLFFLAFCIWYIQCLPSQLFNDPTATVLLDRNGKLLGARIASDGQWRFEPGDSLPLKFRTCILQFEDRNFYKHMGISARGIGRSIVQNVKRGKVVSGGSTITMQLARIMKKNPRRTFREKILEMLIATRLEVRYSKKELLESYAAHAPFGNNVVGLEAASWRYFGRDPQKLSWSEVATLAVLPNAPGLIYPGKNHEKLLQKRNRLLKHLWKTGLIDATTFELAISEPLPEKPLPLPQLAPHLLARLAKEGFAGKSISSTIDANLQEKTSIQLMQHSMLMKENKIFNGAVIITSVKTGETLAYIGNTINHDEEYGSDVDCIMAARSTGSILKPFLYAKALEDGLINPKTLLLDVPTHFGSFSPSNFTHQCDGAVPAQQALSRSLNIPFVRLLNEYGLDKFHYELKKAGVSTLNKPARHYGLSLILGGAEARLWDLNSLYTGMSQSLAFNRVTKVGFTRGQSTHDEVTIMDKACIYSTFESMTELNRPDEDGNWRAFSGSRKIAWKTGTSFGFRDGWAIGVTPDYVVSVWVGNADGEGRPGLTGIKAAAPLMFNVFSLLPASEVWFAEPKGRESLVRICRESGYRAGELCESAYPAYIPSTCLLSPVCAYHQLVHLDKTGTKRVDSECEDPENMKHVSWFILPPAVERYYKYKNPSYRVVPEYRSGCAAKVNDRPMALLYPKPGSRIYVPIEIDGKTGKTVFEATHRNPSLKIYWHLDNEYLGETRDIHQLALQPQEGKHLLMLVDEHGVSQQVKFEVLGRQRL